MKTGHHRQTLSLLLIIGLSGLSAIAQAIQPYRTPDPMAPGAAEMLMDCNGLERALAAAQPHTYTYRPGFYDDPYQGASVLLGTTVMWPAYGYLGYSAYQEYHDRVRLIDTERRIEMLRRLKAEKRCFES